MFGILRKSRRGVATVELAVCLPVLLLFGLGTIEATNAIFLKQRLTAAAYEGARAAIAPGQTSAGATTVANNVLTQLNVTGGTVSIVVSGGTLAVTSTTASGTAISATVTAPTSGNLCMPPYVVGNAISSVATTVVMNHQ